MKYVSLIPRSSIEKMAIVVTSCRKTLPQVKAETGADYILNGGMWNTSDGSPCAGLKVEGKLLSKTPWGNVHGYGWTGTDIHMTLDWRGCANYLAVSPIIKDGTKYPQKTYDKAQDGVRGRSAIGLTKDALVLYCSGDGTPDAKNPDGLTRELLNLGCDSAMMLDGGGSSQCDFSGKQIKASRKVHNWICVWTKKTADAPPDKEEKPVDKYTICIDPGHWPGSVNCAPDKSYWEYEFTWDLYTRLRHLLEKQGFTVVGTRTQQENPSQTARATVSNKAGADLFLSIHSNAVSGGWGDARGFVAYTSSGPETAERNKAATAILGAVKDAGVILFGTGKPYHELFTVLTATTAPAVLLECGFHTNKEEVTLLKTADYRDKLAKAIASGVMNYFGVEEQQPESGQPDQADPWAQEAWAKAAAAGIFDGTRPSDPLTRQEAAVVLDRLGLLQEKGE